MDFTTLNHHSNLRKEFHAFCQDNIKPIANTIDIDEQIPDVLMKKMSELGYLGASIPKEYGGLGLDQVSYGILNEEIGRACSSTRSLLTVHSSLVSETILKWGTLEQKEDILPLLARGEKIASFALSEPQIGSDAKNISTYYEVKNDFFILYGIKKWISFGQFSDLFIVIAHEKNDRNTISAFIIESDTEGVEVIPINGILGTRASKLAEVRLNKCTIPKKNLLGAIGAGFFQIANTALTNGRYSVACGSLGIAIACLEESHNYINSRKQFGVFLKDHQLIKAKISNMIVGIKAARLLCYQAGWLRDSKDPRSIINVSISKYFSSKLANESAKEAVQIQGALGCLNSSPVQRFFRDAKIMDIIEGSNEIQQIIISDFAEEELL